MSIRRLSKELQKKAIEELNEDPDRVKDDIEYIKQWLTKQPHLTARTEDQWLLTFLRGCKFSLQRTKEKLDMFYTARSIAPEFFGTRDPFHPEIQQLLKLGVMLPLRKTQGPDTPRVCLFRGGVYDPAKFDLLKLINLNGMLTEILLNEDDQSVVAGIIFIQDMKGSSMAHMAQMTPALMKKSSFIFQESTPIRPKQIHYLNMPSFFDTLFQMFKPFIKQKLLQRMMLHSSDNLDSLYEHVPREILPREYGGTDGTIQELADYWKERIEGYRQWFLDDQKYGTNEYRRLGKPKTADEIFGIEGSFRKLNVD